MNNVTSQKLSLYSVLKIRRDDFNEFICGWGAAVINVTVTFPINKIIFRQVRNVNNTNKYFFAHHGNIEYLRKIRFFRDFFFYQEKSKNSEIVLRLNF